MSVKHELRFHPLRRRSWKQPDPDDNEFPLRRGGSTGLVGFFGMTRDGGAKMHKGVDCLTEEGAIIGAAHAGEVLDARADYAGVDKGYGLFIKLLGHDGTTQTRYAHMAQIAVSKGDRVKPGEVLGTVGRTGNVAQETPTHLHWEVRLRDEDEWTPVDPYRWLSNDTDPDTTTEDME